MGFYGNITNTSRTQFQFDKIYPSRAEMDAGTYTDGIYAGRYVLVEYDSNVHQSSFYRVWIKDDQMYSSSNFEDKTKIYVGSEKEKENRYLPPKTIVYTENDNNVFIYYKVNEDATSGELLTSKYYKQITSNDQPNYTQNYTIDTERYGAGRGYDSTVWQKAYIDNTEKYIMIAELNSVVPTFDVSADAPTVEPITPHFDTQSTDLYYKLHWQPTWGMRIAKAGTVDKDKTIDETEYPSDQNVKYTKVTYNKDKDEIKSDTVEYKGAIYYNKDGFGSVNHIYKKDLDDQISVKPTGKSGMKYNQHGGKIELTSQPDIQEISIMLPSLGNTLCDIWDKVYGYNSTKVKNNRYRDIEWKDANPEKQEEDETLIYKKFTGEAVPPKDENYKGNEALGGMTRNSETLAGCINMAHDLMGMIITTDTPNLNETEYQKHLIYYKNKKYYRIYKYPKYKVIDNIDNATEVYLVDEELENDEWKVRKYNKKASVPDGKKLAIKDTTDSFGYKLVEIEDFAGNLNTINGLIVSIRNILESDNSETRNTKTVQGTINVLNDIIDCFNDLIPGEFLICNNDGKVNSAGWTTSQAIKYDNLGDGSSTEESEGENQWINLSINADANKEKITLKHQLAHSRTNTITNSNKNNTQYGENSTSFNKTDEITNKELFSGINNDNKIDTLKLYTPIVDNAGHVVGKNTETVTLPYGYKYLETNNEANSITGKDLYTDLDEKENILATKSFPKNNTTAQAGNTQDKITINTGNKWIQTKIEEPISNDLITNDTITIAHEVHNIVKTELGTNNNGEVDENGNDKVSKDSKDNIVAYDVEVDAAGHVTKNQKHTYTLPYGFKTIKTNGRATNNNVEEIIKQNNVVADNTQDELTIDSGNEWIKITTNASTDTITISHDAKTTSNDGKNEDVSLSKEDDKASFSIPVDTYDNTNHYSGRVTTNYILPNNYGKIEADNTTTNPERPISEASSSHDTLSLTGDDWIGTSVSKDVVSFNHKVPQENGLTTTIDSITKTPALGGSFSVPKVSYDKNGHIYNDTSYDITLPSLELSGTKENTDNNVMTNFTYTKNGTVMTATFGKIGDLALTGYSTPTSITKDISDLDNLNTGLGKLRYYINKEVIDRENAIKGLTIENGTSSSSEARPSLSVANTITSLSYANSTTTYTVAPIQIEQSQVIGLQNTLEALLNKITVLENKVSELESKQNS